MTVATVGYVPESAGTFAEGAGSFDHSSSHDNPAVRVFRSEAVRCVCNRQQSVRFPA